MAEVAVAVRDLVAFCHRRGDIDHRFTPSPSAEQGVEGHQRVYSTRPDSYRSEYPVAYRKQIGDMSLLLRGRADGYDPEFALVEEIKTCRVPAEAIPDAVSQRHLAQAKIYAAIIAACEDRSELEVRLTWFNIDSGEEHRLSRHYSREELTGFLQHTVDLFADWLQRLAEKTRARNRSLDALDFPYGQFRSGQRDIAELVYKAVDQGGQLVLEAPTGIGKTAAVLYPALKALAREKHDRILFLTAKSVGRRAAEDALRYFDTAGMQLTALSLTAKEKACLAPGSACHPQDCPYARGYYDRLPGALNRAMAAPLLDRQCIEAIAGEFTLCPYQLSLDLLPWVDLVVCDLHYVYGTTATVAGIMRYDERRWTALLDEAHNLPDRARSMYRGTLAKSELMAARGDCPETLRAALDRVNRTMLDLQRGLAETADLETRMAVPSELTRSLQLLGAAVGEALADEPFLPVRHPRLMAFYFDVLQFVRVSEDWGEDYRFQMSRDEGRQSLKLVLNCLDPHRKLAACQQHLHALVAFSATLSPPHWVARNLGLTETAVYRRLESPFSPQQLQVDLATAVDTRYRVREATLPALASTVLEWLERQPGNCIVYFPSYHYLGNCLEQLQELGLDRMGRYLWVQERDQSEAGRGALLECLQQRRDVVAFCILGGVFGEGVDLPGEQLRNVIIVGVGMPQYNSDTQLLSEYYRELHGAGFEFTYLYPGMQKVSQALGRVVRSVEDHGRALLIDSRFARAAYRALLPDWWEYRDLS